MTLRQQDLRTAFLMVALSVGPLWAQAALTVNQLVSFVQSSIQLKHPDKQVASYLLKLKLSERLDANHRRAARPGRGTRHRIADPARMAGRGAGGDWRAGACPKRRNTPYYDVCPARLGEIDLRHASASSTPVRPLPRHQRAGCE